MDSKVKILVQAKCDNAISTEICVENFVFIIGGMSEQVCRVVDIEIKDPHQQKRKFK